MASVGSEGLVLGAGHHLPDASLFETFKFDSTKLALNIWTLPEYPDAVLRMQSSAYDEDAYWQLARQGIAHLGELRDHGIPMPGQRFIVGPDEYVPDRKCLYTVAERIDGDRELSYQPQDSGRAHTAINGIATYLLSRLNDPKETRILFDVHYPWQYTILKNQPLEQVAGTEDFMLHDDGLEFATLNNPATQKTLRNIGVHLVHWADMLPYSRPTAADQLIRKVEPLPERLRRQAKELVGASSKLPTPPPRGEFFG